MDAAVVRWGRWVLESVAVSLVVVACRCRCVVLTRPTEATITNVHTHHYHQSRATQAIEHALLETTKGFYEHTVYDDQVR